MTLFEAAIRGCHASVHRRIHGCHGVRGPLLAFPTQTGDRLEKL